MGKKKRNKYMLLLVLLLGLSLGYALISTTLKNIGYIGVNKNNWSIYFDNPVVTQGSVTMDLPEIGKHQWNQNNTKLRWKADFNIPGDFYEFTVDIVNAGSIDAIIDRVEFEASDLPDCMSYSVKYIDGTDISEGDKILKATKSGNTTTPTTKKIKVRIEYDPESAEEIDELDDETYNFDFSLNIFYIIDNPGSYSEEEVAGMYYAYYYRNPYDEGGSNNSIYSQDLSLYDYPDYQVGDTLPLEFSTVNNEITVNYNGGTTKDYRDLNLSYKVYKDQMNSYDSNLGEYVNIDYYFYSKEICNYWSANKSCEYIKTINFTPPAFFGYKLDDNRTIEATYICAVYNGEKYCIRDDYNYMNDDQEAYINATIEEMTRVFGEYDSVNGTGCFVTGQYNDIHVCVSPDKTQTVTFTEYSVDFNGKFILDNDFDANFYFSRSGSELVLTARQ